jgi:hypothetical protein
MRQQRGGQYYPAPPYHMPPPGAPPQPAPPPAGVRPVAVPQEQLLQTATIRNAVNLKKNSLALVPVDSDPRRLAVSFTFDSSVPCRRARLALHRPFQARATTPAVQHLGVGKRRAFRTGCAK